MAARRRKHASLVSVHMDLGAGRRGVDMGPSAIRTAGVADALSTMGWRVVESGAVGVNAPERTRVGSKRMRYYKEVLDVCKALRDETIEVLENRSLPVILGGDHSIAMGSVSGVAKHFRRSKQKVGLLWIDAHTDMNLPGTTPSGNIHGMPLSHLIGEGDPKLRGLVGRGRAVDPEHVALLGIRSVDRHEREVVHESGVRAYTMHEIDERGIAVCVEEALERVTSGTAGFHLSYDLDGVDPRHAPGVGTPVPGGLTYREAHYICEAVAQSRKLLSLDMVELNPTLDVANQTGRLAVELIASALGRTIL